MDLSVFIWKMGTVILFWLFSGILERSHCSDECEIVCWNIKSYKIYKIVILVLYVLRCFAIIFPNRLSCLRNISTVIVYFIFPQSSWYRGNRHWIYGTFYFTELMYFVPGVSNSNSYRGYMKDINWIIVGSGEKLWPIWRVNSVPKDIQIRV